jgi:hypothetical protein
MRVCSLFAVVCCGLVLWSTTAQAQARRSSRRTTAEAMRQKGLTLVKHADIDIDGDGRKELFCIGRDDDGLRLVLVGEEPAGAVVLQVLPDAKGKDVVRLQGRQLIPPRTSFQVALEVSDDNPDEDVTRVHVYGMDDGVVKEMFSSVMRRSHNTAERPVWESDPSIVHYGDVRGGWSFVDEDSDGVSEIRVRRKPQLIEIAGDKAPVRLVTGVRDQVWKWNEASFSYVESGEVLQNFLPALEIVKVTASSAWIPPEELKALQHPPAPSVEVKKPGSEGAAGGEFDFGLEDLEQPEAPAPTKKPAESKRPKKPVPSKSAKPKGAATSETAADSLDPTGGSAPNKPAEAAVVVDRSPYMRFAADRNLATAWIEDADGVGKGEWIELELAKESPIRMVRVVAGCVATKESFTSHNVPESMSIQLSATQQAVVNRRQPTSFVSPVLAFSDSVVPPAKERPWAKTTLVFFDGKTVSQRVRLTLDKVAAQGDGQQTCISEVSIH